MEIISQELIIIHLKMIAYENDSLTVDSNFGNELVAPLTFECDGDKVHLETPNPYYLYRLDSDCN